MNGNFFAWPETAHFIDITSRLIAAVVLGGLVGAERERVGKAAGLRTHMLVTLGAALFVLAPAEAGIVRGEVGRIIQGIAAGIGFIGAGAILKRTDRGEIEGLTTAAGIWLTAAIGVSVAVGPLWVPALCVLAAIIILLVLGRLQRESGTPSARSGTPPSA